MFAFPSCDALELIGSWDLWSMLRLIWCLLFQTISASFSHHLKPVNKSDTILIGIAAWTYFKVRSLNWYRRNSIPNGTRGAFCSQNFLHLMKWVSRPNRVRECTWKLETCSLRITVHEDSEFSVLNPNSVPLKKFLHYPDNELDHQITWGVPLVSYT